MTWPHLWFMFLLATVGVVGPVSAENASVLSCGEVLNCGQCLEDKCVWCGAGAEYTLTRPPTEGTFELKLGKCVESTASCDGVEFGELSKLYHVSSAETEGLLQMDVVVKALDKCRTEEPTPKEAWTYQTCTACVDAKQGWCNCAANIKHPLAGHEKIHTFGGICAPVGSSMCSVEFLRISGTAVEVTDCGALPTSTTTTTTTTTTTITTSMETTTATSASSPSSTTSSTAAPLTVSPTTTSGAFSKLGSIGWAALAAAIAPYVSAL